ncbi:hypothetical protein RchiOBHm_Chr2g0127321 [Rosa chinensis]|uniref:Uncharacterized protein n=1 Tax=Rosa chinensis TaxID=74649 RepID=A0A2P6RU14_ROSCH|nr:hypothetical protein RchiOBHm_Chr2g0127321 [Rosa chinensis]
MNNVLARVFQEEEVFAALKQKHSSKALGVDSFSPYFYQSIKLKKSWRDEQYGGLRVCGATSIGKTEG